LWDRTLNWRQFKTENRPANAAGPNAMSRWRPPRAKSSPYITPEGARALKDELQALWLQRRQDVVPALQAAAAEGDRSENAEYIYRKKQLAEMDRRIRYLSRRLDEVQTVHGKPPRRDRVFFGARVTLEDDDGTERRYRIVGADETDRPWRAPCWARNGRTAWQSISPRVAPSSSYSRSATTDFLHRGGEVAIRLTYSIACDG
jgi:transcription elongation factor GreB